MMSGGAHATAQAREDDYDDIGRGLGTTRGARYEGGASTAQGGPRGSMSLNAQARARQLDRSQRTHPPRHSVSDV
jgi:hypothetical protein